MMIPKADKHTYFDDPKLKQFYFLISELNYAIKIISKFHFALLITIKVILHNEYAYLLNNILIKSSFP